MLVAYLDETYLKNKEHALIALVLPADKIAELEAKLDQVVEKAQRQHDLADDLELHGYELYGGTGCWEGLAPRARLRIYQDAIDAIASIDGAAVCHGSVDLSLRAPKDAHMWALTIALERVSGCAHQQGQKVVGICDDVGNKVVYQRMYAYSRKHGTPGPRENRLVSFTDGLHFTPSCYSRPVQAVDLVAYVYRRTKINPHPDPRAHKAMTDMYKTLDPLWLRGSHRKW